MKIHMWCKPTTHYPNSTLCGWNEMLTLAITSDPKKVTCKRCLSLIRLA